MSVIIVLIIPLIVKRFVDFQMKKLTYVIINRSYR